MAENTKEIAIIGAGFAGAVLANRLSSVGFQVTVLEKSRGTGGRLCSSRSASGAFDLGAPYISAETIPFKAWLNAQATITPWQFIRRSFNENSVIPDQKYCALPKQSAITRALLANTQLRLETEVVYLWPEINNGENRVVLRNIKGLAIGTYSAAVITAPAKQAANLLEAIPRFSKKADVVPFSSNWVLALEIAFESATEFDEISGHHPVLFRCIKNNNKPARQWSNDSEIWIIEASQEWSQKNINADKSWVYHELRNAFLDYLPNSGKVISQRTHRWLYSRHIHVNDGFLWDSATGIGACGDWLHKGDVEGAWFSANAIANRIIAEISPLTEPETTLI